MATKKSTNGKKRQSPSQPRLLALALTRLIECLGPMDDLRHRFESSTEGGKIFADLETATGEARQILKDTGFEGLESVATRVAAINEEIDAARIKGDGKALEKLGPALTRAQKGLPPLVTVEKKSKSGTERKPKVSKAVQVILDAFDKTTFAHASGSIVTSIKASEDGKGLLCQYSDDVWVTVNPKDLKPLEADASEKGSGTPSVPGELSDATVQTATN